MASIISSLKNTFFSSAISISFYFIEKIAIFPLFIGKEFTDFDKAEECQETTSDRSYLVF